MAVIFDPRTEKFLDAVNDRDKSKVREYVALFEEYGFGLDTKYLKKVSKEVWELRPGRIRLFLYTGGEKQIVVHANYKKSQKILLKDMKLIANRIRQYI